VGLAISVPAALAASRLVKSFLFGTQPNDPGTLALAGAILLSAAILAGYPKFVTRAGKNQLSP
jgi:hypothetical protein